MIKLNGQKLNFKSFPNGETLVDGEQIKKISGETFTNVLTLKYEDDRDLLKLMFARLFLSDLGLEDVNLVIRYMPYSRMDRVEGDSVFTLKYVSAFINNLGFNRVEIHEPHSDVTPALIDRSVVYMPTYAILNAVIMETRFKASNDYLFFPDASSHKRYGKIEGFKQLAGFKKRNFQTGHIERLDVVGDQALNGAKVIILDDLCSKGGTFMLSAKKLKEMGAGDIHLIVAHTEDSIHSGELLSSDLIKEIWTTDSIIINEHPKIRIIKL